MDPLTHAAAGALLAQGIAPRGELRRAALVGAVAGLLPDADILIRSAGDPLYTIEYHRHFTHSLLFVPLGALVVAAVLSPCLTGGLRFGRAWLYAAAGMLLAGIADAMTSFGTHLFWPLGDGRVAWNLVAVVDPVLTVIVVSGVVMSLRRIRPGPARIALVAAAAYVALAFVQHERATNAALALANDRGHTVERIEVKPTLGNIVLWRSVYEAGDRFYVDAVRVGAAGGARIYPGQSLERFEPGAFAQVPSGSTQARDIERFARLSDDYLVAYPGRDRLIGDIRYAMLPDSIMPLWAIALTPQDPDRHVEFVALRDSGPAVRRAFMAMLLGKSRNNTSDRSRQDDRPALQ